MDTPQKLSVLYHDLFDYPLKKSELLKWHLGKKVIISKTNIKVTSTKEFYYVKGRQGIVTKRLARQGYSAKKLKIATQAGDLLGKVPSVKMIGITGALAMTNSDLESDIDLLIVTSKGLLWTTRLLSYILLKTSGFKVRKPKNKNEKDKLCLNMWLDESDLVFKKRNIFTAHEIAQIKPIVNKDRTYETLLSKNKWILDYWPRAIVIGKKPPVISKQKNSVLITFIESIVYKLQFLYMKSKITREVVTPTRAFFHPYNWSNYIKDKLEQTIDNNSKSL